MSNLKNKTLVSIALAEIANQRTLEAGFTKHVEKRIEELHDSKFIFNPNLTQQFNLNNLIQQAAAIKTGVPTQSYDGYSQQGFVPGGVRIHGAFDINKVASDNTAMFGASIRQVLPQQTPTNLGFNIMLRGFDLEELTDAFDILVASAIVDGKAE